MRQSWQIQEAKNRLSEVVDQAIENGAQVLTRRGEEVAVVLSFDDYRELKKKRIPLSEFFRSSPLEGLELERDRSGLRPGPDL